MKIRRGIKNTSEINMASTSDIAFLLIIFFMITSAFIFKDGIHLVLPNKSKKPQVVADKDITTITIRSGRSLFYDGRNTDAEEIGKNLNKLFIVNADSIVLLKIDKKVPYQEVVDVIDIVKLAGIKKLSLRMM
jgi:biopolymer transport protein ExbD